jgi:hypothetical protein
VAQNVRKWPRNPRFDAADALLRRLITGIQRVGPAQRRLDRATPLDDVPARCATGVEQRAEGFAMWIRVRSDLRGPR